MSDKKHIDRLFQEHLKNLDQSPDPDIWKAIEAELHKKKKKKRVIPLWWRAAGVAALLLLFLALGTTIFKTSIPVSNDTPIVLEDSLVNALDSSKISITKSKTSKPELNKATPEAETKPIINASDLETEKIAHKTNIQYKAKTSQTLTDQVSHANSSKTSASTPKEAAYKEALKTASVTSDKKAFNDRYNNSHRFLEDHAIAATKLSENAKTSSAQTEQDSIKPKNTLTIEDAIAQVQPEEKTQAKRWDINPNLAPVYYHTGGTGSHLDDQFVSNSKTGEVNTSYGVSVGYALNNKLKIRSGINSLKLSFNTNDVVIYANATSSLASQKFPKLKHVNASGKAENLNMVSANVFSSANNNSFFSQNETAIVNQNINYYEVPLELEYNIINKRFGLNVFGGFSTFFLDDNAVYTESNIRRSYIGKANNLNDISFSTNLGIGVDYNFSKRFNINLEPTVKYQINAYNETSGSVKPYILGVYTGFSYKF